MNTHLLTKPAPLKINFPSLPSHKPKSAGITQYDTLATNKYLLPNPTSHSLIRATEFLRTTQRMAPTGTMAMSASLLAGCSNAASIALAEAALLVCILIAGVIFSKL